MNLRSYTDMQNIINTGPYSHNNWRSLNTPLTKIIPKICSLTLVFTSFSIKIDVITPRVLGNLSRLKGKYIQIFLYIDKSI